MLEEILMPELRIARDAHLDIWHTCSNCESEMIIRNDEWELMVVGDNTNGDEHTIEGVYCPNCNEIIESS